MTLMALMKQEPLREVENLPGHFREAMRGSSEPGVVPEPLESASLHVDVRETPGHFQIKAEIPDVRKEDLNVDLTDGVLTISGERRLQTEGMSRRRLERYYCDFARRFMQPDSADGGHMKPLSEDGLRDRETSKTSLGETTGFMRWR